MGKHRTQDGQKSTAEQINTLIRTGARGKHHKDNPVGFKLGDPDRRKKVEGVLNSSEFETRERGGN